MSGRLIALAGRAGSGKNTVATMLEGYELSFAEPMKRFCQEVFNFSDAQIWGPSDERNRPDPRYLRADGTCLSPREALQKLGTEWGRACFENVWAELGVRRAQMYLQEAFGPLPDLAVITDCRFINEAAAVRRAGGEVWRIVRPGTGLVGTAGAHVSELEQETPEFLALVTRTIENTGTIDDLRSKIVNR